MSEKTGRVQVAKMTSSIKRLLCSQSPHEPSSNISAKDLSACWTHLPPTSCLNVPPAVTLWPRPALLGTYLRGPVAPSSGATAGWPHALFCLLYKRHTDREKSWRNSLRKEWGLVYFRNTRLSGHQSFPFPFSDATTVWVGHCCFALVHTAYGIIRCLFLEQLPLCHSTGAKI